MVYLCCILYFRLKKYQKYLHQSSLANAIDISETVRRSQRIKAIYITPPDEENNTDEDSGDEHCNDNNTINNLGKGIMAAEAEIQFSSDEENDEEQGNSANLKQPSNKWKNVNKFEPKLQILKEQTPLDSNENNQTNENTPKYYFEKLFDNSIVKYIVKQSNKYAQSKNFNLNVSENEIRGFFGAILISGYTKLPDKKMYWSKESDVPTAISECFTRKRFEDILHYIHFSSGNSDDKIHKIRPFVEALLRNFKKSRPLAKDSSIDESMIAYFGPHSGKQFIQSKPIRFGFKNWALCAPNGYLYAADLYMGRNSEYADYQKSFGVGGAVVLNLIEKAEVPGNKEYTIYMDNYFSSEDLFAHLAMNGIGAVGTIRKNRISKPSPLQDLDSKKMSRGDCVHFEKNSICLTVWKDNALVSIISNCVPVDDSTINTTTRWSSAEKKKVQVSQPRCISLYNRSMGGVDQMDNNISLYRSRIRQRKWYWPIITYYLDIVVSNAWILSRDAGKKMSLLEFRRTLALCYLKESFRNSSRRSGQLAAYSQCQRFDGINHWPVVSENCRRCQFCHKGKSKTVCEKCDCGLHNQCFKNYHTVRQ